MWVKCEIVCIDARQTMAMALKESTRIAEQQPNTRRREIVVRKT